MNFQDPPLVSILITAYNREKYIGAAIESVLASSYQHFEIIIVDDCSTDNTLRIIKDYEKKDTRIKVYKNEKNLTDYPNRNKAASYAKGKYLKYIDSDDILYPFGLEMIINRIESHDTAAVCFAKRSFQTQPFPILLNPHQSYYLHFIDNILIFSNAPTSAIINREKFNAAGGFSGLNQYGDYEFWLKISAMFPVLLVEGDITWDRDHDASEKYKDDAVAKSILYHKLTKQGLENSLNPLSAEEKKLALKKHNDYYMGLVKSNMLKGNVSNALTLWKSR